jgi:hypothetical protein
MDTHAIIVIKYRVHPCASIPCDAKGLALLCSPRRRTDDEHAAPFLQATSLGKKKKGTRNLKKAKIWRNQKPDFSLY